MNQERQIVRVRDVMKSGFDMVDGMTTISEVGEFDSKAGTGIAFQVDVEDAVGVSHQIRKLSNVVEEKI